MKRDDIQKVMRSAFTLFGARLGGANFEFAIHGDRVTIHDFAVKVLSQEQRQRSFAASSRSQDCNQQRLTAHFSVRPRECGANSERG